jgi:putative tryptophan/tyrosine transport system substrate-binding protein
VRRREFIALLGGAVAARPLAARAQQKGGARTLGVLMGVSQADADSQTRIAAFLAGFAELGWKDGENIRIEYRWSAGRMDLIEQYARELVALAPAVILANGTPAVAALQKLTASIPIVCALVNDPVGLGFVKSLSHPDNNITGFTFIDPGLIGKWMQLLKDSYPALSRAALLFNPATAPFYWNFLRQIAATQEPAPLQLAALMVGDADELESAVRTVGEKPGGSLLVGPDPFNIVHIRQIAQFAVGNRVPAISVYRPFAVAGGLMAYGPDTADIFRRAAGYVDRILKGASPAELPVQQPIKFEFIVNVGAAKALGIEVPPTMLALADEVIE